jgi:hypothetical protein
MRWSNGREALAVVVEPQNLRKTIGVAAVVGTVFFAVNQMGPILSGHADLAVLLKSVMTYLTPFCVSNYSLLMASRVSQIKQR